MRLKYFLFFIFTFSLFSDDFGSISGYVMDSNTKETIIGATVYLVDLKKGNYSNTQGLYKIQNVPAGKYKVRITYVGYEAFETSIEIKQNENLRKDFMIKQGEFKLDEIVITAEKEAEKKNISISKVDIPVQQLKQIRIGGEADVFRALQFLPGVLTSSQISNGLYIRGGSPDQNLVQIDGATVYNPSHLFGFISTFNADALKDVELIKGGFNAEYGGRMSAVLNITQRDGNKQDYEGKFNIGALSSKVAFEGPLGNGSFFVGGRRTYFELIKSLADNDPDAPLPDYNFYDVNMRVNQDLGINDRIFASAFLSADNLGFANLGLDFGLGISNTTGSLKWNHIHNNNLFSNLVLSYSKYQNNLTGDNSGFKIKVQNSIRDYSLKYKLDWDPNDYTSNKFGVEVNSYKFSFLQDFTGDLQSDSASNTAASGITNFSIPDVNISVFAQSNYQVTGNLSLQGGLRYNYYDFSGLDAIDPRLAFRYQFNEKISIKGAWGIYHQNLKLASQPDFSFFDTWLGTDTTLSLGRSDHYILSLQTTPFEGYDLNFDIYYKTLKNINELKNISLEVKTAQDALYQGMGEAFGFEVFIQKKYGKFGGWIGYGFGVINAQFDSLNNGSFFNPKYDRRHDFKVVAQYQLTDRWDVGANFTLQGGQPYTDQVSRGQKRFPDMTLGRGFTIPSQRYGLRLPETHFLNVSATWKHKVYGFDALLIFDIYNVYNRRDIFFRRFVVQELETKVNDVKLIPIIPSISWEINFK